MAVKEGLHSIASGTDSEQRNPARVDIYPDREEGAMDILQRKIHELHYQHTNLLCLPEAIHNSTLEHHVNWRREEAFD
jgi:hypothetical protein